MKLKNKKGFTLIELLAVIVVLAIIALIATPIVMNTIKNAKKGAAERTADNYIKQVETAVAESRIDGTKIANGTYNIQPDGNLCPTSGCGENDKDKITIDMSGNKPSGGTVTISNGGVLQVGTTMTVGDYDVIYSNNKCTAATVVYRWSMDSISIGNTMNDSTKYTKDPSTLGKNYYLKHVLDKDNKVTESYVCVIYNNKEYCVRGGDTSFYTENKKVLEILKEAGLNCELENGSYCIGPYNLLTPPLGSVMVTDNGEGCYVNVDGSSYCIG